MISECDINRNNSLDEKEIQLVYNDFFSGIKDFNYFTEITIRSGIILSLLGIVMAFCLCLYALGFLFGRTREKRTALAVGLGQKNTSLAIWIGLSAFGPLAAVPPVIYILCHHLISAVLILFYRTRKTVRD